MSGTIAQLGLEVDSSQAAQAATDLDKLTQAGAKAEKAAEGLADGFDKAGQSAAGLSTSEKQLAESVEDARARLLAMAKASLDASEYHKALTTGVSTSASAMNGAQKATTDWAAVQAQANARGQAILETEARLAEETKKAAAATGIQAEGLQTLLGKINPTLAALQKLDDQQAKLKQYNKAGLLGDDEFKAYTADIDAARSKLKTFNDEGEKAKGPLASLELGSKGARENVLQLGNALAEGNIRVAAHNILEIGANAGASSLEMAKMAAPAGALVAVLGAVAFAFADAEKELSAFNFAIFAGGNVAGVTAEQLQQIAKQAGLVTNNFVGAREAAIALAASGKVAQSDLLNLTEAAAAIATFTGNGAGDVARELAAMGASATDAAGKISEQYGLLTSEQYLAIKAIEDNGEAQKALDLLSEDLNKNAQERLKLYRASQSDIEQGWDDIKNSINRAYSAVKGELFPDLAKQIEIIQRILDTRKAGGVSGAISSGLSGLNSALGLGTGEDDDSTAALEKRLAGLKARQQAITQGASATSDSVVANKELIAVQRDLDQQLDNVSPLAKREAALKKLNEQFTKLYQDAEKTGQKSPLLDGVDYDGKSFSGGAYDKILAGINTKNKDAKVASTSIDLTAFNDQKNALAAVVADYQNAEKQLDAEQKQGQISQEEYVAKRTALINDEKDKVSAAYDSEIAALEAARDKSTTTGAQRIQIDQKIADAKAAQTKALQGYDAEQSVLAINEQGRVDKQTAAVKAYTSALQSQVDTLRKQGLQATTVLGMGDRQATLYQAQRQVDAQTDQAKLSLASQYGDGSRGMSLDEYNLKLAALKTQQQDLYRTNEENYADMTKAQGDWSLGASSAWQNYLEEAQNVAGQTKAAFTSLFDGLTDAAVDWAFGADETFGDVAVSFAKMLAKMALQAAASSVYSSIFGAVSSSLVGGATSGATASSTGSGFDFSLGSASSSMTYGRATGGSVDPNTMYQVNEKGPELFNQGGKSYLMVGGSGGSVTPLSTSSMVGASAGASSAASGVSVSISIATDGTTDVSSNQSGMQQFGSEIGKYVESRYKELEARSLSAQGNIRKAINGRA